jgi:hypothetical protein
MSHRFQRAAARCEAVPKTQNLPWSPFGDKLEAFHSRYRILRAYFNTN